MYHTPVDNRPLASAHPDSNIAQVDSRAVTSSPSHAKSGTVVACSLCRRCKAKCVKLNPGDRQCERCMAAGCVCTFEKHRRGRKRVRGLELPRADVTSSIRELEVAPGFQQAGQSTFPVSSLRPVDASLYDRYQVEREGDDDVDGSASLDPAQYTANPLPFISGADRPFSLRSLLTPSSRSKDLPKIHHVETDIISRGLVLHSMALRLYDFFFDTLNPIILLLDPDLHTFEYIRDRSGFLFTSILLAAARFMAPSLVCTMTDVVKECSVNAILGGHRSIETVQSWMVMYFWKAPNDDRGWTYVGLLCRLAVEIGLDRTPTTDMPGADERDSREQRNRVRTWMLAYMMDRALSSTTGRDWCIRGHDPIVGDPRAFTDHPLRIHGDAVIAGFTELRRISCSATDRFGSSQSSLGRLTGHAIARELLTIKFARLLRSLVSKLIVRSYDLDEWKLFWETELASHHSPERYWAYLRFFELHIRLTLNSFAIDAIGVLRPMGTGDIHRKHHHSEQYCYEIAMENLIQLQRIRDLDISILQHAQDSIAVMVAYAACFLRFVSAQLCLELFRERGANQAEALQLANSHVIADSQRQRAADLIASTSLMFKTASQDRQTTAALQAKFLGSLFGDENSDQSAAGSSSAADGGPIMAINPQSHGLHPPWVEGGLPSSNAPGPELDFSDFESWLSAFESSTIPDPHNLDCSASDRAAEMEVGISDANLPSMANTDWDAIFLSWLNPEGPT